MTFVRPSWRSHGSPTRPFPSTRGPLALALLALSLPAWAQHGAHVHGQGQLGIALQGEALYAQLSLPAVNAVGFEHPPRSEEEEARTRATLERFQRVEQVLRPSAAAGCTVAGLEVALPGGRVHSGDLPDDGRGHTDKDDRDEHDNKHEHDSKHEHAEEDEHGELHARYAWRCDDPARLDAMEVGVFAITRGVESLLAEIVTGGYQGARTLTAGDAVVRLRR